MTDFLERLAQLLPPPAASVAQPPWERSRAEVGFAFPSDYQAFVDRYGGGYFSTPYSLNFEVHAPSSVAFTPGSPSGFEGLVDLHVSGMARTFDRAGGNHWGGADYSVYPEPGGLLTWGENAHGDLFWWLTEGDDPDAWPVVMWARGPATTYRFDAGMVEFLHSMVNGDVPGPSWMRSAQNRWTMTHDWLHRTGDRVVLSPVPVVEIHVPLLPVPHLPAGASPYPWIEEVEDFLTGLEEQGDVEVFMDGEKEVETYVFFITGAGEEELLAVASRVATLPGVPTGSLAVVGDDATEDFGQGRRVPLPVPTT